MATKVQKVQLEVKPNALQTAQTIGVATAPATPVKIVKESTGPVSLLDKLKGYYHTLITVLAAVLVLVNEVTPATDFLPATARHWISVGIVVLTAIINGLKSNEHWVDDL